MPSTTMRIGVTGTRKGATVGQRVQILDHLRYRKELADQLGLRLFLHHGDCVGVDVETAEIADSLEIETICHPPVLDENRAFHQSTEILTPRDYLERDRAIVDACDFLMVVPLENEISTRGGTWYTYRYANKRNRDHAIFWP